MTRRPALLTRRGAVCCPSQFSIKLIWTRVGLTLLRLVEVGALHRMHPFSWMQLKPLLAGIVALAVCYLANRVIFDWHTVLVLVVGSIIFLAAYVGSLILLGLQPDDLAVLAAARRKLVRIFL